MVTMIVLGAVFYVVSIIASFSPDWKAKTFFNFYSDAMWLGAAIAAKEPIFICIFAVAALLSVGRIYLYTKLTLLVKEVKPMDQ